MTLSTNKNYLDRVKSFEVFVRSNVGQTSKNVKECLDIVRQTRPGGVG